MEFLVLDFETACKDKWSICQVGLVKYNNGKIITLVDELINPHTEFEYRHFTEKHNITSNDVKDSPSFDKVYPKLKELLKDKIVFNHNNSDKAFFEAACSKFNLEIFDVIWLNSATLVKRTWTEFSKKGYGVENMAKHLQINFKPHNAASDSFATAKIIQIASEIKGYSIMDWKNELTQTRKRNYQPYDNSQKISGELLKSPNLDVIENKENPFYGKQVCISGEFKTWPDRTELGYMLRDKYGAKIDSDIRKKTFYFITGEKYGPSKFNKMLKKIDSGEDVQILNEDEILKLLSNI